jgi:hypothetical protein
LAQSSPSFQKPNPQIKDHPAKAVHGRTCNTSHEALQESQRILAKIAELNQKP